MSDQNPPQYPSFPSDQSGQPGYIAPPPGYAPANHAPGSQYAYDSWGSRLGAYILDALVATAIAIVPIVIGAIIAFSGAETDPVTNEMTGVNPLGVVIMVLGYLSIFAFVIWNQGVRMGKTGQSLGKKWLGIKVVRNNGELLGAGLGVGRWFVAYFLGGLCLLDYLWPLWDEKKQTWHDKIVSSVVIRA